jgi:hypothetical protein
MSDAIRDELCQSVNLDEMMKDLEEFARRVKLSGTAAELESFHHIRARLDAAGYQTTLLQHDAYISLPGAASLSVGNEQVTCITHSFSRPSAAGGTRGDVVYWPANTRDPGVAGKIVVFDGIASPAASLRASQAGALGQIHVSPHQHIHEMCISPVWGSPTPETLHLLPTTAVVSIAKADGDRLKARLAGGEVVRATIAAEVETQWCQTPILVAELMPPGADETTPFVLFSGHHDTWHYGVMDNGSANATMMEVARLAAPLVGQWRRGLRLCFWSGHSHGRYSGSAWYADHYWSELERRCVAHVNIDSTGGIGATVLNDVITSTEFEALGADAVMAQTGQEIVGRRMARAGDQSFWGIGIPSLYMGLSEQPAEGTINPAGGVIGGAGARKGGGLGWWWHTPDDTLDKIDPAFLVRDARVYVHTVWRLLTDRVLPMDYGHWAKAFGREIDALQSGLPGFDLTPLQARIQALVEQASTFAAPVTDAECAARNRVLMAVSRALVPIDYTRGDRFEHDPALGFTSWPPLDPIRALLGAHGDAAKFRAVAAVRARNRVAHALDAALAALGSGQLQAR